MRREAYKSRLIASMADGNAWRLISMGLLVGNLMLVVLLFTKSERTVVAPPVISKTFWVEEGSVSEEYLEQMSDWFVSQALNISPANVDYKAEVFLRNVVPEAYGQMKSTMAVQAERIKRHNGSQVFYANRFKIDPAGKQVVFAGQLKKWVGEEAVSSEDKAFRIRYRLDAGRLQVSEFKEASWNDPFNAKSDPDYSSASDISKR